MRESWVRRIRRAEHLQEAHPDAKTLLEFYAWLLRAQEQLYLALDARPPSGTLTQDLGLLRGAASPVLLAVAEHGPDPLVTECRSLIASGDSGVDRVLLTYWDAPTDRQFFAKAILQPYMQWLADSGIAPRRGVGGGLNRLSEVRRRTATVDSRTIRRGLGRRQRTKTVVRDVFDAVALPPRAVSRLRRRGRVEARVLPGFRASAPARRRVRELPALRQDHRPWRFGTGRARRR